MCCLAMSVPGFASGTVHNPVSKNMHHQVYKSNMPVSKQMMLHKYKYTGNEGFPNQYAMLLPTKSPGYFDVILAVGAANLRAGDSTLGVTRSEIDTLKQTNRNS